MGGAEASGAAVKRKAPDCFSNAGLFEGEPGGDLLSHTVSALSSARLRFTVLFEMGRGGSEVLWPPSVTCPHDRSCHAQNGKKEVWL